MSSSSDIFDIGSSGGVGLVIGAGPQGATLRLSPHTQTPYGPNVIGDIYMTTAGVLRICTEAGSPGKWVSVMTKEAPVDDTPAIVVTPDPEEKVTTPPNRWEIFNEKI